MKYFASILVTISASLVWGQLPPSDGSRSLTQMRRNYPGGRDDSDLAVQVLPQLKKKSQLDQEMALDSEGGDFEVMDSAEETPSE